MSLKVISTLVLNGVEKLCCAHGNWITIAHAAHLTGNHLKLMKNASYVIQSLLKRHPQMRTRLRVDVEHYLLEIFEYNNEYLQSDLFFSVMETADDNWQKIVEYRCNQDPYSENETIIFPLFHFMLLLNSPISDGETFHLILFENHCVADGRSGFILINDFLTLATDPNLLYVSEPVNQEIFSLMSPMISRPYGLFYHVISFIVKHILKYELRQQREPRIPVQSIPIVDCEPTQFHTQRYKIKFLFASSSVDLYEDLHQQCRLHEVTLNGPLFACLLLAIHHCFPIHDNTQLKPFGISVAFDMRSRLPRSSITSSSVGFFACGSKVKLNRSFSIRSTQFWRLVRRCMTITRNQLKQSGIPLKMNIFADIFSHETEFEYFTRHLPEGRRSEFAFSNIGKYPFSCEYNHGEVRLQGLHVINNSSLYRFSTVIFITCAGDGGQLDFSIAHEMRSDEKSKEFFDYYLRLIKVCANKEYCKTETTLDQLLKAAES